MQELRDDKEWALDVWHKESIFRGIINVLQKYVCDYFADCGSCPLHLPDQDGGCMKAELKDAVDLAKKRRPQEIRLN